MMSATQELRLPSLLYEHLHRHYSGCRGSALAPGQTFRVPLGVRNSCIYHTLPRLTSWSRARSKGGNPPIKHRIAATATGNPSGTEGPKYHLYSQHTLKCAYLSARLGSAEHVMYSAAHSAASTTARRSNRKQRAYTGRTQQGPSLEHQLGSVAQGAANLFPLWLVIGATAAVVRPSTLTWFKREYITKGLALIMLVMGTTLTLKVHP